jgi:hypothetical protein
VGRKVHGARGIIAGMMKENASKSATIEKYFMKIGFSLLL